MSQENKEPSVEQIMKCHRMMVDSFADYNYPAEKLLELNELEQIIGPYDTHEILFKHYQEAQEKISELEKELNKERNLHKWSVSILETKDAREQKLVKALKYYASASYYDGGMYTVDADRAKDILKELGIEVKS